MTQAYRQGFMAKCAEYMSDQLNKKAASKKEDYQSGSGKVESYTKDKTKDHDEIVVRTKDGRRVVVSNNTRLGKRVEPKKGDPFGYHGYAVRGTNVIHKVHPNKKQPGGWLEHVKTAQKYDEKKWPDYEEYVKEHPDKKIELVERLVREHYAKQRPWGMKTESGYFVPKDKVTRKAILNAIVRGGDDILRQRRGMCHELAAARMKMLGDNGVEGHRAFAFWGEPAAKQAPDGDWLLGHSMVFFRGDDGKMHFASPKMRDKPRKNFGRFDDLKDAIRQYIAAIKDSGGLRDDDFVRIYDTTDVKFPDRAKYLDYVDRAKTGPVLYEQAADREFV